MSLPNLLSGFVPSGDDFTTLQPLFAYKTGDESLTSNTTAQDDDELFVTGLAGAIYTVDTYHQVQGVGSAAAGNIKLQWTFPTGTGAQLSWSIAGMAVNDISAGTAEGKGSWLANLSTTSPLPAVIAGTPSSNWTGIVGRGLWIVGATGGVLRSQWAQSVSSGTATTVRKSSWMRCDRVV